MRSKHLCTGIEIATQTLTIKNEREQRETIQKDRDGLKMRVQSLQHDLDEQENANAQAALPPSHRSAARCRRSARVHGAGWRGGAGRGGGSLLGRVWQLLKENKETHLDLRQREDEINSNR